MSKNQIATAVAFLIASAIVQATTPLPATGEGGSAPLGVRETKTPLRLAQSRTDGEIFTPKGSDTNRGNAAEAAQIAFNIPAQPLNQALNNFAQQAGLRIVFDTADAEGVTAPALNATLTADQALKKLLETTELKAEYLDTKTIAIHKETRSTSLASAIAGPLRLAQSEGTAGAQETSSSDEEKKDPNKSKTPTEVLEEVQVSIPEILIKGARSLNADIERTQDDIQPYVVLDRKLIERSAATNVEDLLRTYATMNYVQQPNEFREGVDGAASKVALSGLNAEQTLILIDGRRASARAFNGIELQPDLNGIPLNAIERIEILPATASGIYGGSATGGVVNVILRRDYSGLETRLTYENSFQGGGAQRRVDINGGFSFNGGRSSALISAGVNDRDDLRVRDRKFYSDYVQLRDANSRRYDPLYSTNFSSPLGSTTNISSAFDFFAPGCFDFATGGLDQGKCFSDLRLKPQYGGTALGSPIAHVPMGYAGVASDGGQAFLQTAGLYNVALADTDQQDALNASLLNEPRIRSIEGTLRHNFREGVEAYLTASQSRTDAEFTQNSVFSSFTISGLAPNNPFEQDITVTVPVSLVGNSAYEVSSRTSRALVGAKVKITKDWSAVIENTFDRNDYDGTVSSPMLSPLAAADIASGAFDVLSAPPPGGFDLSAYLLPRLPTAPSHSRLNQTSLRVGGPAFSLPAGPVVVTALLEHGKQSFSDFTQLSINPFTGGVDELTYTEQSSRSVSAYLETQIPLVSEKTSMPGLRSATLQVAARFDDYRTVGGVQHLPGFDETSESARGEFRSVDPTIGLKVQPVKNIALRASYGTGFFPPELIHLRFPSTSQPVPFTTYVDPKRGNESIANLVFVSGGNPNLKPESSSSRSLGVILTPFGETLRISVDWIKIDKRNNITQALINQNTVNNEDALPGVFTRGLLPNDTRTCTPVCPIIAFDGSDRNATRARYESYNIDVSYLAQTDGYGTFEVQSRATRLMHSSQQLFPLEPLIENAGVISSPTWQANASLTWSRGPLSTTWFARYLDEAWITSDRNFSALQGSDRVPSQIYHDFSLQYQADGLGLAVVSDASLQLGVKNIFNTKPRFMGAFGVYDSFTSPMLATYYASLTLRL